MSAKPCLLDGNVLTVRAILTNVTDKRLIMRPKVASHTLFDNSLIRKPNQLISDNTLKSKVSSQLQLTGEIVDFPLMTGLVTLLMLVPLRFLSYYFVNLVILSETNFPIISRQNGQNLNFMGNYGKKSQWHFGILSRCVKDFKKWGIFY
ncbi:hypothetical protein Hs30E_06210 [Lactococcus hodotermopsidis]|uniref:Uncharacterized protein n=1 Tax=Pseudolactococcus hodotermopsidis TaxID=2709157 RepID=A0A6A0B9F2_9LACT|nr:hypothetical protein [Lactococcus hodotermopsidis]GFH42070.1 hypothetical protein Hs30E_06210 [Lactococcus hodotermopsidis]